MKLFHPVKFLWKLISPPTFYGSGSGKNEVPESFDRAASEKRAALQREQWQDYQNRFQPVEDQIIDIAGKDGMHTTLNTVGVVNAQRGVNTAFDSAQQDFNLNRSRYGYSLSDAQAQSQKSSGDMARASSMANETNTAKQWDSDRRNAIMSGGLSSASSTSRG